MLKDPNVRVPFLPVKCPGRTLLRTRKLLSKTVYPEIRRPVCQEGLTDKGRETVFQEVLPVF